MNLIFLCGAGGAGKTTVRLELGKRVDVECVESSSRTTLARLGIPDEEAALKLPDADKQYLQDQILRDYMNAVHRGYASAMLAARPVHYVVVDRSPFDHLAYWLRTYSADPKFDVRKFDTVLGDVVQTLDLLGAANVYFCDFPIPKTWHIPSDGQRSMDRVKRLNASKMISGIIAQEVMNHDNWFHERIDEALPQVRAEMVLDFVSHNRML